MANYIVSNATFTPYTYEELIKPYENYLKEYAETEAGLASLAEQAAAAGGFTEEYLGTDAQTTYKNYNETLNKLANDFYQQGYSSAVKRRAIQSKADYKSQIEPIINADTAIKELIEEQRKGNPKGDIQYTNDASDLTISKYLKNPRFTYEGRSLSEMEKAGTDIATAASSRKTISEKAKNMANQYYKIITGYDKEDVENFIQQNQNSPEYKELMNLYNQIKEAYGTNSSEGPYSADQNQLANERILLGMLKGLVNKVDYSTNHWGLPGAKATSRSSSGRGSAKDDIEYTPIGYSTIIDGVEYVKTNESGETIYYDLNGKKYVWGDTGRIDSEGNSIGGYVSSDGTELDFTKQSAKEKQYMEERFAVAPVNNSGTMVYVVDLWDSDSQGNPKKVTQNGHVVTYDRSKQTWNAVTRKVENIPSETKTKTTVPKATAPGYVFVSNSKGKTSRKQGDFGNISNEKLLQIVANSTPLNYNNLSDSEKSHLPEIVKKAPNSYIFYKKSYC